MENFRKIAVRERLPSEKGRYNTDVGYLYFKGLNFYLTETEFIFERAEWFLEPTESREAEYREVLERAKGVLENCAFEVKTETHYQICKVMEEIETLLNKK